MGDDYKRVLAKLAAASSRRRFDGVFIDPPYGKGLAVEALEAVALLGLVKAGGWVTVEVGRREETPETVTETATGAQGTFSRVREDIYGDTKLALYEAPVEVDRNEPVGDIELPAVEADR
jgi:16S rRNA G966 N2-methylase RsmD